MYRSATVRDVVPRFEAGSTKKDKCQRSRDQDASLSVPPLSTSAKEYIATPVVLDHLCPTSLRNVRLS